MDHCSVVSSDSDITSPIIIDDTKATPNQNEDSTPNRQSYTKHWVNGTSWKRNSSKASHQRRKKSRFFPYRPEQEVDICEMKHDLINASSSRVNPFMDYIPKANATTSNNRQINTLSYTLKAKSSSTPKHLKSAEIPKSKKLSVGIKGGLEDMPELDSSRESSEQTVVSRSDFGGQKDDDERCELIEEQEATILMCSQALKHYEKAIEDRDQKIVAQEKTIAEQNQIIIERDSGVQTEESIRKLQKELVGQRQTIAQQKRIIIERQRTIKERNGMIIERNIMIRDRDVKNREYQDKIKSLENENKSLYDVVELMNTILRARHPISQSEVNQLPNLTSTHMNSACNNLLINFISQQQTAQTSTSLATESNSSNVDKSNASPQMMPRQPERPMPTSILAQNTPMRSTSSKESNFTEMRMT